MPFAVTLCSWDRPEPDLWRITFNFQGPKDEPLTEGQVADVSAEAARMLNDHFREWSDEVPV